MTKRLLISACFSVVLISPTSSMGQLAHREEEKSPLDIMIRQFPSVKADSVQVRVFTRIPLDNLVFTRRGEEFRANYELSVFAMNKDGMVDATRLWKEEVFKSRFTETQSVDMVHLSHTAFDLAAGKYEILVNLVDQENRQRYHVKKQVDIAGYAPDQLVVSDILLLSGVERVPGQPERITPIVGNQISDGVDSFYVYFRIRNPDPMVTRAALEYSLLAENDTLGVTFQRSLDLEGVLTSYVFPLATSLLKEREHTLKIRIKADDAIQELSAPVRIAWAGFSNMIEDVEMAIEQTRYVATKAQMQEMRRATGDKKRETFLEFWRGIDPTPETPRNELMDEYYRRVAYANAHFKSFQSGWETDLGMVYIIYGQPDDIERHPFDVYSKPYQIWFYYDKGWRFVFVDVNMFGDYRLVTPLYPSRSF